MSEHFPEIDWEKLKVIVDGGKVEELKSCEVCIAGTVRLTAIIYHGDMFQKDYAKIQAGQLAIKSNIGVSKDPAQLLKELQEVIPVDKYSNLAKARATRKAKRLAKEGVVV